jgi:hypothetical protein
MNNYVAKFAGLLSLAWTLVFFSPPQAAADDNPAGRVAHLSYEQGTVYFEPGGSDEWVAASINRPMTTRDKLRTEAGALAEIDTGSAYIRVSSNTGLSFLNFSDSATQIQLKEGIILVRVRRLDQDETFEIDTPKLAFSIYQTGIYKVILKEAGDVTVVQVRRGEGAVVGGPAAYSLQEGDEGRFAGTDGRLSNIGSYHYHSDDFENWSTLRDQDIDHSYYSKYLSPRASVPNTTTSPASQPWNPGFSKEFLRAGIEEMSMIREWRSALASAVQNGEPVTENWIAGFRGPAATNLGLASVAASTDSDRNAFLLLTNEFDNMNKLSDRFVAAHEAMHYTSLDALKNDPLDQQVVTCARSLASMTVGGEFVDDPSCH